MDQKNIFEPANPDIPVGTVERIKETTSAIDFSQLAPLVTEFQKGEVEKKKIDADARTDAHRLSIERLKSLDLQFAEKERRQDRFDLLTAISLYVMCAFMTGYGMWHRDAGFITAGISSFGTYLAGIRSGKNIKPRVDHAE